MTAMVYTTLSAAAAAGDTVISVAAATGMTAPVCGAPTTLLYIDFELMEVVAVNGLAITVRRGISPTAATAHPTSSKVWVGPPGAFLNGDPSGTAATTATGGYYPAIVPKTRRVWDIVGDVWKLAEVTAPSTEVNVGTAGTLVTAAEYGDAFHHQTRLTLALCPLLAATTNANLAIGHLIYTFPAGAIVVKAATMSVGLTAVASGNNADTPEIGVGTVLGVGAQATIGAAGATMENIITGNGGAAANCTGTELVRTVADTPLAIPAASVHTVYLNAADGWAAVASMLASGTVVLDWEFLPIA